MRFENFNWIRQADGLVKKTPNGGYVMINEVGCCYGFSIDKLDDFRKMFKEIEKQQCAEGNHDFYEGNVTLGGEPAEMCLRCNKTFKT